MRKRIYELMLINNPEDDYGDIVDVIIIASIVINVVSTFLLTFNSLSKWFTFFNSCRIFYFYNIRT